MKNKRRRAIASVVGMLFILALSLLLTAYFSAIYSSYSEYNTAVNVADQIILQRNQERLGASLQASEVTLSSYWGGSSLIEFVVNTSNGNAYSSCAGLPLGVPPAGQETINLNSCGVGNGQSLLIITDLGNSFVVS
ncbi:MAG: hypothetical protein ABSE82_12040 [Nitrososphaerales archaeon]|jgi:hypothetical protein